MFPSYPQTNQSNQPKPTNSMTVVSGTVRTPGKPWHNYMCSGNTNCTTRH